MEPSPGTVAAPHRPLLLGWDLDTATPPLPGAPLQARDSLSPSPAPQDVSWGLQGLGQSRVPPPSDTGLGSWVSRSHSPKQGTHRLCDGQAHSDLSSPSGRVEEAGCTRALQTHSDPDWHSVSSPGLLGPHPAHRRPVLLPLARPCPRERPGSGQAHRLGCSGLGLYQAPWPAFVGACLSLPCGAGQAPERPGPWGLHLFLPLLLSLQGCAGGASCAHKQWQTVISSLGPNSLPCILEGVSGPTVTFCLCRLHCCKHHAQRYKPFN